MILSNEDYCSKMTTQIERGSFFTLLSDINKSFQKEVEDFIKKSYLRAPDKKWSSYIKPCINKPGNMV